MKIESFQTDDVILTEIGKRLAHRRINLEITQATLATQAGVSKRTIERAETGESTQLSSMIRILRALGLLEGLERTIPETGPSPMDLLKLKGKKRRRVSSKQQKTPVDKEWSWGEES